MVKITIHTHFWIMWLGCVTTEAAWVAKIPANSLHCRENICTVGENAASEFKFLSKIIIPQMKMHLTCFERSSWYLLNSKGRPLSLEARERLSKLLAKIRTIRICPAQLFKLANIQFRFKRSNLKFQKPLGTSFINLEGETLEASRVKLWPKHLVGLRKLIL